MQNDFRSARALALEIPGNVARELASLKRRLFRETADPGFLVQPELAVIAWIDGPAAAPGFQSASPISLGPVVVRDGLLFLAASPLPRIPSLEGPTPPGTGFVLGPAVIEAEAVERDAGCAALERIRVASWSLVVLDIARDGDTDGIVWETSRIARVSARSCRRATPEAGRDEADFV